MTRKRPPKPPTLAQLRRLHAMVRRYCNLERAGFDVRVPEMVEAWRAICRAAGVRP